ncbi:LysE family translocator [Acinetobacter sp. CWB-G5]|uniref:LysE family translocator n=1 Tax=Acinetobacter sp. CWB-G5 TaxID=2855444 RepID=UPI001C44B746|nr:LysE family translocator [Acinetobacter sp. CWB-G5]MBV7309174.1 LysE family translocator [Acinetobacter sp. CWB-G5]
MKFFIVIAVTHFVALLSPGPDFFLILMTALNSGQRRAQYTVFGIVAGNAFILALIFTLLGWLGHIHAYVLMLLHGLGVAYLLYLSIQCFRYKHHENVDVQAHDSTPHQTKILCFTQGLQSSLLNPKNMMFYSSLILLVYAKFDVYTLLLMSLWMVTVVLIWNLLLLKLLSWKRWNHFLTQRLNWLYKMSGCCFASFALVLLLDRLLI